LQSGNLERLRETDSLPAQETPSMEIVVAITAQHNVALSAAVAAAPTPALVAAAAAAAAGAALAAAAAAAAPAAVRAAYRAPGEACDRRRMDFEEAEALLDGGHGAHHIVQ
jgi:hypothetical protein